MPTSILTFSGKAITSGTAFNLPIMSGKRLKAVTVQPETNGTPITSVRIAIQNAANTNQDFHLPYGHCFNSSSTVFAYSWFGDVLLPDGQWQARVSIFNLSGVEHLYNLNFVFED